VNVRGPRLYPLCFPEWASTDYLERSFRTFQISELFCLTKPDRLQLGTVGKLSLRPRQNQGSGELLAGILTYADAITAFFGNKWRLSEDLLSDGAARCIARLLKSDQVWHQAE
jgi:hypothetical protein